MYNGLKVFGVIGVLALAGLTVNSFRGRGKASEFSQIVISGTSLYDIDSMGANADRGESDVWFRHVSRNKRILVPMNGVQLTNLGLRYFDDVGLEDLISADYSEGTIVNPQIGEIIGICTNKGNYAKLKVDGYRSLNRWNFRNFSLIRRRNLPNYDLEGALSIYEGGKN